MGSRPLVVALALIGCAGAAPSTKSTTSSAARWRGAEVGKPAPELTLSDLDGKSWSVRDLRGSVVVLEWFNPKCTASRGKGSLVATAKRQIDRGVVWLAVNSTASGREGFGREDNLEGKKRYAMDYPILFDQVGVAGHAYGATRTPEIVVIDKEGTLVYRGALDNSPDGDGSAPEGGALVNYVDEALAALDAGRALAVKETKVSGCSIAYAR